MTRHLIGAAAQMGPISRAESRESCVRRMSEMMRDAAAKGARFVVFPELALTSFRAGLLMIPPSWINGMKTRCQILWFSHYLI